MNSGYSDVRYMVYIWGFPCLDYPFDVLTSQISNMGLYSWFYHIYFTCRLLTCSCMPMLTTRFSIHTPWLGFIYTYVLIYACHLALTSPLIREFWLPWPVCSDLGAWTVVNFLVIRVVQRYRQGSAVDCPKPYPSRLLCSSLEFFFITRERHLYCSYM